MAIPKIPMDMSLPNIEIDPQVLEALRQQSMLAGSAQNSGTMTGDRTSGSAAASDADGSAGGSNAQPELPPEEKPVEEAPSQPAPPSEQEGAASEQEAKAKAEAEAKAQAEVQAQAQAKAQAEALAAQQAALAEQQAQLLAQALMQAGQMPAGEMPAGFTSGLTEADMAAMGGLAAPNGTGGAYVANQPKLIISNYVITPEMPKAGEEFTLTLTFQNTNASKSVSNIKITLGGEQAPQTALSAGLDNGGQTAGGSVFTPVGSSNTFYVSKINPQKTGEVTVHLKTSPTVAAQNYSLNVSAEYEDGEGNPYTANESIGVPITQTAEILLGDLQYSVSGDEWFANMPMSIDMDLYNIGKAPLSTFMVTLEGTGFDVTDSPRYFIGNFAPGASDHFAVEITPVAEKAEGAVVVTYEDATGKKYEERKEFSFPVSGVSEEAKPERSDLVLDEKTGLLTDGEGNYYDEVTLEPAAPLREPGLGPLWIGGIVVVVLVGIILLRRRHRAKKKQREGLDLHE